MAMVNLETQDQIGIVTIDRPESLNALSGALCDELTEIFKQVGSRPDIWVMVLRAAGEKAFCVGADLKERASFELDDFYSNRRQLKGMFQQLRAIPQPTVCSVFGYALGGGFELALSCDILNAAEGTVLGLPEVRVGLLPAAGGTQLLTRKVGEAKAKELIFRGRRFDAEEGQRMGLVCSIVPRGELDATTFEMAKDLCKSSPVAVREAKRAIEAAFGFDIEDGIEVEHQAWEKVIVTEDRKEGIDAFNDKREPEWNNR